MAPKPLIAVAPKSDWNIGPDLLAQRPKLAVYVAAVISQWAWIETLIETVFVKLLRGQSPEAMAIYRALKSERAQRDAIFATARVVLAEDGFDQESWTLFARSMEMIRAAATQRHIFAHHIWGRIKDIDDVLLTLDPEEYLTAASRSFLGGRGEMTGFRPRDLMIRKIQVWTEVDLQEVLDETKKCERVVHALIALVTRDSNINGLKSLRAENLPG